MNYFRVTQLKKYEVSFRLNVIEFRCVVRARNKKEAIEDVKFNINMRTLKRIRGISVTRVNES